MPSPSVPTSRARATAAAVLLACAVASCAHESGAGAPGSASAHPPARTSAHPPARAAQPTLSVTTHARPTPPAHRPVVVLDPGHNGRNATHPEQIERLVPAGHGATKQCNTTGTATDAGYPEHAFTWDVAGRVRRLLAGAMRVVLTRPNDDGVGPCVDERAAIGNRAHADAVVSIHGDGSLSGHGFHVIEAAGNPGGQRQRSDDLAHAVHDAMLHVPGLVPATYVGVAGYNTRSDLAGLNLSTRPSILVECGNMRNPGDAAIMSSPSGRERIAQAIAAGIRSYLADSLR